MGGSHEAAVKLWLGLQSEGLTGLEDPLPLAWQLASPRMSDSIEREGERERDRQTGRERWRERDAMKRVSGEKYTKDGSHRNFYNIILEMTSHPFFHILLVTKTNSGTVWEVTTQGCE